jgi:hypothetical protein
VEPAVNPEPQPLVSCLCVTESRPQFWPWLWWSYVKQDHPHKELVVIDSSPEPMVGDRPGLRLLSALPGTSVAAKRNMALRAARGSVVAWFDDDDWQHPRRLSLLVRALSSGARVAGHRTSWFVEPAGRRARRYISHDGVIFNGLAAPADSLADVPFDERVRRAADTSWVRTVTARAGADVTVVPEPLSLWLCHRRNLSNPVGKHTFPEPLSNVRSAVGPTDWGETDEYLAELVEQLRQA